MSSKLLFQEVQQLLYNAFNKKISFKLFAVIRDDLKLIVNYYSL